MNRRNFFRSSIAGLLVGWIDFKDIIKVNFEDLIPVWYSGILYEHWTRKDDGSGYLCFLHFEDGTLILAEEATEMPFHNSFLK